MSTFDADIGQIRGEMNSYKTFNISINNDDCLEFYDMELDEATEKISEMIKKQ